MWKFGVCVLTWPCADRGLILTRKHLQKGWEEEREKRKSGKSRQCSRNKKDFFFPQNIKSTYRKRNCVHVLRVCMLSIKLHTTCWPHFVFNRITDESKDWSPLEPSEKWIMAKKNSHKGKSCKQYHYVQYISTVLGICVPYTQNPSNLSCFSEFGMSFSCSVGYVYVRL